MVESCSTNPICLEVHVGLYSSVTLNLEDNFSQDPSAQIMASKCVDITEAEKQEALEDITTCCICTEVFTDPKALPCLHTFCMKCLRQTGFNTNKEPGDEMPCPICRRRFKIPTNGFSGLPKHFFIDNLIRVSRVPGPPSESRALCSLCQMEDTLKETPAADAHCVDCKHNLCAQCCNEHIKFKLNKKHKLVPINEYECIKNEMVCEIHEQQSLEVFCADCKTVECAMCFIEKHNSHECSPIKKCVDGFRKQIENNTEAINKCISDVQVKKAEIQKVMEEMQRMVNSLECDIKKRTADIKEYADKDANCLTRGLLSEKQSRQKEIQMVIDDINAYLSSLENYNSHCQRLLDKQSNIAICREISDLSLRATELQQQCQPSIERGVRDFKICFRPSELEEFLEEDCGNLIGEIEEERDLKPKKRRKEILLTEHTKEINILRQETEDLGKQRASYNAHIEELKEELQNNNTTINALNYSNDKLKQEHDELEAKNHSLQLMYDKEKSDKQSLLERLVQEQEANKAAIMALQDNNDKLKQEHDAKDHSLQLIYCKEQADNQVCIQTFQQELEANKAQIMTLQDINGKLMQEYHELEENYHSEQHSYHKEQADNQVHIDTLLQELKDNKAQIMTLQDSNGKLMQEHHELEANYHSEQLSYNKEQADHIAYKETTMHERESHIAETMALKVCNDKLKQELDALETTKHLLQTNNDKLVEDLELYKAKLKTLGAKAEKPQTLEIGHMTNNELKRRFLEHYISFISHVDAEHLGDHLKQDKVITVDQWQTITAYKLTPKDKCRSVLDFLLTCDHPSAFVVVRQALQKIDHHILKIIEKKDDTEISTPGQGTMRRFLSVACDMGGSEARHHDLLFTQVEPLQRTADKECLYTREQSFVLQQDQQLHKQRENYEEQPRTEVSLSSLAGSMSGKMTYCCSAKGPVVIAEATSDFVILENTGRKRENLSDWFVKISMAGSDNVKVNIPRGTVLKPRSKYKVQTRELTLSIAPCTEEPEVCFGQRKEVVTTLHNPKGDERASITQRTVYAS